LVFGGATGINGSLDQFGNLVGGDQLVTSVSSQYINLKNSVIEGAPCTSVGIFTRTNDGYVVTCQMIMGVPIWSTSQLHGNNALNAPFRSMSINCSGQIRLGATAKVVSATYSVSYQGVESSSLVVGGVPYGPAVANGPPTFKDAINHVKIEAETTQGGLRVWASSMTDSRYRMIICAAGWPAS